MTDGQITGAVVALALVLGIVLVLSAVYGQYTGNGEE